MYLIVKECFRKRPFQVTAESWKMWRYNESVFHYTSTVCEVRMYFRCDSSRTVDGSRKYFHIKVLSAQNNTFLLLAIRALVTSTELSHATL